MSCDCSRPIIILSGGSGGGSAATLYTTSATLLGDRVVNANNNDLTFNMGTGSFIVNGTVSATGFDLTRLSVNPGDSTTLWVSGLQDQLMLGDFNISLKVSNDAGNLLTVGSDDAAFFSPALLCFAISNCSINSLYDVNLLGTPADGTVLTWSNTYAGFIPQAPFSSFIVSDGSNTQSISNGETLLFSPSGRMKITVSPTDKVSFKYDEILTRLSYNSGTNLLSYVDESGNATNLTLNSSSFSCSNLNSCSINSLGDVSTSGAVNGQVLAYNGSSWAPTTISVSGSGGGSFTCLSLSGCSASSLQDITYPSAPTNGQSLTYSSVYSAWIPQTPYQNFDISDGSVTQTINSGNTITFSGAGRLDTVVQATDTVVLSYNEVLTTLTYDSGTNALTYIDESGASHVLTLITGTGGGTAFSCSSLNSCSVSSLSDVTLFGTPTNGDALTWSNTYSAFIPQQPYQYFTISDGINTQQINSTNTITFSGAGKLDTLVQATDTIVLSYAESLTSLSFDSGTNVLSYVNESGSTANLTLNAFACSDLNSCSINALSDVSTSGAVNGQVLAYNGAAWTPTTISVSGGGSFTCLSLSGCAASSLQDVVYPGAPANGDALIWSNVYSAWVPQTPFQSFNITDGSTSQTINSGNQITFTGVGRTSATVQATDTVVIGHTDVLTTLSFDSGTNILSYVNESGATTNLSLNTPSGGATFTCSDLNSCSVNSLSDVLLFGTPTNGQALTWSNTYSSFIPQTPFTSFTLSDGTNTQTINNGNILKVLGAGRLSSVVSATDTVTLSYEDILTTLSYDSGTNILTYTNESGTVSNLTLNSFNCSNLNSCSINSLSDVNTAGATTGKVLAYNGATWVPTTVATSGGGSFSCLSLSGCTADSLQDIIYPSGPSNGQALVWSAGSSAFIPSDIFQSFTVTDGVTSQTINSGNSLRFSGGGDISVAVSATDRVAISFTETVTTLTYNSGLNRLTYVDENGSSTNINLVSATGGGSFSCSSLNSCSIDALSDVNVGGATSGKYLKYNGSQWVHSSLAISADAGNDLTLGTDGNPYLAETVTSLTSVSGSYLKYTDENGGHTDINICGLIGSCSINSLSDVTITAPTTNQILRWNGSNWVNSTETAGASYSFTISDGVTSQTISNGNTLTFADTNCINATVSATDTVAFAPILAPSQNITSTGGFGLDVFSNNLTCTAQGIFAPCILVTEPTATGGAGNERFVMRIPCGNDFTEYTLPYFDNIKRVPLDPAISDGDPAEVGVDLFIDGEGGFFYNDGYGTGGVGGGTYHRAKGTYGYATGKSFTAGVPDTVTHNLGTSNFIAQVYKGGILQNDSTIEYFTDDTIRVTTTTSGPFTVCVLPVYDK